MGRNCRAGGTGGSVGTRAFVRLLWRRHGPVPHRACQAGAGANLTGSTATFRIDAALEAGRGVDDLESALVSMRVMYHSAEVFREEDGICDLAESCPLPRDGKQFRVVYVKEFPVYTPPGSYEVELRGHAEK